MYRLLLLAINLFNKSYTQYLQLICPFFLQKIMYFITLVLENLALSSDNNEDLVYCLKVKTAEAIIIFLMHCWLNWLLSCGEAS